MVLSGAITRLDADQYVRKEANVAVDVALIEPSTGRRVFSKSYKSEKVEGSAFSMATGVFGSVDDLRALTSAALQEVVDGALDDPELRAAIR